MLQQLIGHQNRIEEIISVAEEGLRGKDEPDVVMLARVRWRLGRALREYQLFKHGRLFDPLISRGGPDAELARRMKAACIKLGDEYRDHTLTWSQRCVEASWRDYQAAALKMIARLREHMRREREGAAILLKGAKPAPLPLVAESPLHGDERISAS